MAITRMTLGEFLGVRPEDLAGLLGEPLDKVRRLLAEPVFSPEIEAPERGEELFDAFNWGLAIGIWEERYRIEQTGRLIELVQRRLGRTFVRF